MSWKKISDVRIVCKRCNNEMVFETSRNMNSMVFGCNNCKEQVLLKTDSVVGDEKSQKDGKHSNFCIIGGLVKSSNRLYCFKICFPCVEDAQKYKEMCHIIIDSDGFLVTTQLGYYDKKEE